jgi:hypothetical protein
MDQEFDGKMFFDRYIIVVSLLLSCVLGHDADDAVIVPIAMDYGGEGTSKASQKGRASRTEPKKPKACHSKTCWCSKAG